MVAPKPLSTSQISFLAELGFTDKIKDGFIKIDELPHYTQVKLNQDQSTAFRNLAVLAGDPNVIDGDDMNKLMRDPKALASLIEKDPEYRGDIQSAATLQVNKKEVKPDDAKSDARDGIPPVAYKRLVYYAQAGLNLLAHTRNLPLNGVYRNQTQAKVAEFQKLMGLEMGAYNQKRDGSFIDRATLGSLILRLKYTSENMVETLNQVHAAGYPDNLQKSNSQDLDKLLLGLQYLYPNEVSPWKTEGRLDEARPVFKKHFDADMVGPKVAMKMATLILRMDYLK